MKRNKMGISDGRSLWTWNNCSLLLLVFGFVFYLVAINTDYWGEAGVVHFGLWRYCNPDCAPFAEEFTHDWVFQARLYAKAGGVMYALIFAFLLLQTLRKLKDWPCHPMEAVADCRWPILDGLVGLAGSFVLSSMRTFHDGVTFPAAVYLSWYVSIPAGLLTISSILCFRAPQIVQRLSSCFSA